MQAQVRAREVEAAATRDLETAADAARSTAVAATVDTVDRWPASALGVLAFALAAIALLAGELLVRSRREEPRAHEPVHSFAEQDDALHTAKTGVRSIDLPIEHQREYLRSIPEREQDFYRALAPRSPPDLTEPQATQTPPDSARSSSPLRRTRHRT